MLFIGLCLVVLPIIGLLIVFITSRSSEYRSLSAIVFKTGLGFGSLSIVGVALYWKDLISDDPDILTIIGRLLISLSIFIYLGFGLGTAIASLIAFPLELVLRSSRAIKRGVKENVSDSKGSETDT